MLLGFNGHHIQSLMKKIPYLQNEHTFYHTTWKFSFWWRQVGLWSLDLFEKIRLTWPFYFFGILSVYVHFAEGMEGLAYFKKLKAGWDTTSIGSSQPPLVLEVVPALILRRISWSQLVLDSPTLSSQVVEMQNQNHSSQLYPVKNPKEGTERCF